MKAFCVNIISLGLKTHHFDFVLSDAFFQEYGADVVSGGQFRADVELTKKETFIEARFIIDGQARLVCDRSLESFDQPLKIDKKMIFKYGEEEMEMTDEIVTIRSDRVNLDLGQYLYEFVVLEIPIKKLHPKFEDEEDTESEGKMVYYSDPEEDQKKDVIDPRWEQLKKLK